MWRWHFKQNCKVKLEMELLRSESHWHTGSHLCTFSRKLKILHRNQTSEAGSYFYLMPSLPGPLLVSVRPRLQRLSLHPMHRSHGALSSHDAVDTQQWTGYYWQRWPTFQFVIDNLDQDSNRKTQKHRTPSTLPVRKGDKSSLKRLCGAAESSRSTTCTAQQTLTFWLTQLIKCSYKVTSMTQLHKGYEQQNQSALSAAKEKSLNSLWWWKMSGETHWAEINIQAED